ncbi:MAG TPA: hypothetical protein VGK19_18100 [Capsulimonadaceae bacterium]|jgi:hypothetical protein
MSVFPCSTETARAVAHALFALEFVGELEGHDYDLSAFSGKDLATMVEPLPDARLLPVLGHLVGQVEGQWGVSITVVFSHMSLDTEAEKFTALLDLCLGCLGHGVSIADSHQERLTSAEAVLGRPLPPCPLATDYEGFSELAQEVYDERFVTNPDRKAA